VNPFAARVARTTVDGRTVETLVEAGSPVRGQTVDELPFARLRRLGANDDALAYLSEAWESQDAEQRAGWVRSLSVMTDAELAADLVELRVGQPRGRIEHEGGGWYSLWIDGVRVSDETVRGRDDAERALGSLLAGRG